MGAAGVALVALQPRGATVLAGGAAVWMAVARLPLPLGFSVGGAVTVGLALAAALAGSSAAAVVAGTLLCVLLGLVAYFIKQARMSQDTTELLLAAARGRTGGAAACGGSHRARPDRGRAARRACPLALRRGDPAAGGAQARRARAGEPADARGDRPRRASWFATGLPTPGRRSARSAATNSRA